MTLTGILTSCAEVIMTSTSVVERSVNVTRPDDHTSATYDSLVFTSVHGSFTCTAIICCVCKASRRLVPHTDHRSD